MGQKSNKGGRDHARGAAGDLLNPQPAHQLSGQSQAQIRLTKNDKSTSTRALLSNSALAQARSEKKRNRRESTWQVPRPNYRDPSDSEGDSGYLIDEDEIDEEVEDEDGSCCDPYDD